MRNTKKTFLFFTIIVTLIFFSPVYAIYYEILEQPFWNANVQFAPLDIKTILFESNSKKKNNIRVSNADYSKLLQYCATSLLIQDKLFVSLDNLERAVRDHSGSSFNYITSRCTSDIITIENEIDRINERLLNSGAEVQISDALPPSYTLKWYALVLKYRDLIYLDISEFQNKKLEYEEAVNVLRKEDPTDKNIAGLQQILLTRYEYDKALIEREDACLDFNSKIKDAEDVKSYYAGVPQTNKAEKVIADFLKPLFYVTDKKNELLSNRKNDNFWWEEAEKVICGFSPGVRKWETLRAALIKQYTDERNVYQEYYAATVAELNFLLRSGVEIKDSVYCNHNKGLLLPGISEESLKTNAQIIESNKAWLDSLPSEDKSKHKTKNKLHVIEPKLQQQENDFAAITSINAVEEIKKERGDKSSLIANETATVTLSQDNELFFLFPVINNPIISEWGIFKVPQKNQNDIMKWNKFDYLQYINDWFTDPDNVLNKYGYYDKNSIKYARAYQHTKYETDDQMRNFMRIYHSFPLEFDKYLSKYGHVELLEQQQAQRADLRVFITMHGFLKLKDDLIYYGRFIYIIDPNTKQCFHRMFHRNNKSPLGPTYNDKPTEDEII